jgi:hypothetical protein
MAESMNLEGTSLVGCDGDSFGRSNRAAGSQHSITQNEKCRALQAMLKNRDKVVHKNTIARGCINKKMHEVV